MDEIRLTLFISFEHSLSRTTHNLSVKSISHCILPDHLMILYLLPLLLLLLLLHLAYDETAVMADKNVLSSNEDTQFDDSEAPYLILPHFTLPYLTQLYPTLPNLTLLYPHFTQLSNSASILECGSKIPKTLIVFPIFPHPTT